MTDRDPTVDRLLPGVFSIVLGAPVTLLLGTLPGAWARRFRRLLRTPSVRCGPNQLRYAGALPIDAPPAQLPAGATVMYDGGDLVELALAVSMLWVRPALRRRVRTGRSGRVLRIRSTPQVEARAWI